MTRLASAFAHARAIRWSGKPGQVYIVPTPLGVAWLALTIVVFLVSRFRQSQALVDFGLAMTSLGLGAMLQTNSNLRKARARVGKLTSGRGAARARLAVAREGEPPIAARWVAVARDGERLVPVAGAPARETEVALPRRPRGADRLAFVLIESRFPLGLFRAWTGTSADLEWLTLPNPRGNRPLPEPIHSAAGAAPSRRGAVAAREPIDSAAGAAPSRRGAVAARDVIDSAAGAAPDGEIRADLKPWREGASPRRIDWRAFARERGLWEKEAEDHSEGGTRILALTPLVRAFGLEKAASQLLAWVGECERNRMRYRLSLDPYPGENPLDLARLPREGAPPLPASVASASFQSRALWPGAVALGLLVLATLDRAHLGLLALATVTAVAIARGRIAWAAASGLSLAALAPSGRVIEGPVIGAAWALAVALVHALYLAYGHDSVSRSSGWPLVSRALRIHVPTAIAVLLVYWNYPDLRFRYRPTGIAAVMGFLSKGELAPGRYAELSESGAVAFRARFLGPAPEGPGYWRGEILTEPVGDGMAWRTPAHGVERAQPTRPDWLYEIKLEQSEAGIGFLLDSGIEARRSRDGARLLRTRGGVHRLHEPGQDSAYWGESARDTPYADSPGAAERAPLPQPLGPEAWLRLQAIAGTLAPPASTREALAWLGRLWAKGEFGASLRPGKLPRTDELNGFLLGSRRGSCEHYSAAAASLLRQLGVPSRVVLGFATEPARDGLVTARDRDAHAWVEAWDEEKKRWVRHDPMLAVPVLEEGSVWERIAKGTRRWLEAGSDSLARWFWEYAPRRVWDRIAAWELGRIPPGGSRWTIVSAILAALGGAAWLTARAFRRRPGISARARERFERLQRRTGVGATTSESFASAWSARSGNLAERAMAWREAYRRCRYDPHASEADWRKLVESELGIRYYRAGMANQKRTRGIFRAD